jgi:hypothetical protein
VRVGVVSVAPSLPLRDIGDVLRAVRLMRYNGEKIIELVRSHATATPRPIVLCR